MDYKAFNLERFEFVDEYLEHSHWFKRSFYPLLSMVRGPVPWKSSVRLKDKAKGIKGASLELFGEAICFDDPATLRLLSFHQHRLESQIRASKIIYWLICLLFVLLPFPLVGYSWFYYAPIGARWGQVSALPRGIAFVLFILPMFYLYGFVVAGTTLRFASTFTGRYFAETLCIRAILNLILELSRDDVLIRSDRRKALLLQINHLAQHTRLLSSRYESKDETSQDWLEEHFKHMEGYIRERERWVIAPQETTLANLRQDFYRLATTYITGNYGDFTWPDEAPIPEIPPPTWTQRLLTGLPRFVGVVLPLIALGFFLWRPTLLEAMGVQASVVAWICIGWLLLTIDATLKLGIVAGVVDLAKGIKELT